MAESARVRLIRAAQSDELREIFRQLADIEGPEGPRFSRRVLMDLAARIVGRAYEPMLLELCHLARAALLAGGRPDRGRGAMSHATGLGFEWLFWGVAQARASRFRDAFHRPGDYGAFPRPSPGAGVGRASGSDGLIAGDESVILIYPDGRFEVRYGRMTGLSAMMELIVSALGYRTLADTLNPLAEPSLRRSAVSRAAGDLARRLYEWLGDHLTAAQAQRKFRAMTEFLETFRGADFTDEDIDDETVLKFWLRHALPAAGDGDDAEPVTGAPGDFRGFRTTFLAFLALARLLGEGAELGRFERRIPIGPDVEAGEIDPSADARGAEGGTAEENPLTPLQEEPAAAVKVLNRREFALVALPVGESEGVRRLPRSYLRAECFGSVQNRLSQALRRRAGVAELAALAAVEPHPGYAGQIEALEKTATHLARAARACLYVLSCAHAGRGEETEEGAIRLDFRVLGEARRAFEGLNRAGFERSAPDDPCLVSAHSMLAEHLPNVVERLEGVLRIFAPPERWEGAEAEDHPIFSGAFARLYAPGAAAAGRSDSLRDNCGSKRSERSSARNTESMRETRLPAGERP